MITNPTMATKIGQEFKGVKVSKPSTVPVCPGMKVITPALRNPMNKMKNPMPTAIARLSAAGTTSMTYLRTPSSTRTVINTPSATTTPIASAGVSPKRADEVVGDDGIEAQTRSERESPVRVEPHGDGEETGDETGRGRDRAHVESGRGQHGRVDGNDVGHDEKGRQSRQHLGPRVGSMLPKTEEPFQTATRHSRGAGNGTVLSHDRPPPRRRWPEIFRGATRYLMWWDR